MLGERIDGYVGSDGAERFQLVANAGEQSCLAHTLRETWELLASRAQSEEVVQMMSDLRDRLSRPSGYFKHRESLAPSTWVQYLPRERAGLRRLALRTWTDPDRVRPAKRIHRELDAWLLFMTVPAAAEEPTNNRTERGLRPAVIDRRRMQQNRAVRGVYRDALIVHARSWTRARSPSQILVNALAKARVRTQIARSTSVPVAAHP